jgi:hypothetical protein
MEFVMRTLVHVPFYGLLAAASLFWTAGDATAGPLPAEASLSRADPARIEVGRRWYRDDDDDDFYYPPEYYLPPPPPARIYRGAPPPVVVYEPPVYGWMALPPPPSSCGKYRYWNGERCADARYDPPYIGPRW